MVLQNVDKAQLKLNTKKDNVAGVSLPVFETRSEGTDSKYLSLLHCVLEVTLLMLYSIKNE